MLTATRRAYEQVRCAVVALWSERNQRYAAQTRPGKSNLTQESRFRRPGPLVESTNTKVRLLTRMAFGFKSPEAMIALAMLNLGGYCPPLPGRRAAA